MNKYELKKAMLVGSGTLKRRWQSIASGLYVFNYHRIGDASKTDFDPNVFSSDEAHFAAQLDTIADRFKVINTEQMLELMHSSEEPSEPLAMITFDDGYEDNYSRAFPLLVERKLSAIFFLPTNFIDTGKIPWWDEAAWLVKNTDEKALSLPGLDGPIIVDPVNVARSIRLVLRWFKDCPQSSAAVKLKQLTTVCQCELDAKATAGLFMSWPQACEMSVAGMDIGSHTSSHKILSHLNPIDQRIELEGSKKIIEAKIGSSVSVLAYPVGGLDSYTRETVKIAEECGYEAAFNFIKGSGYNANPRRNPYDIARISVADQASPADIKISTISAPRIG